MVQSWIYKVKVDISGNISNENIILRCKKHPVHNFKLIKSLHL